MTKSIGMIVAGEIGAAETRLALCGLDVGRPIVVVEETVPNSRFPRLAPMVQGFLQKYRPPQIRAAAFILGGAHDDVSGFANPSWAMGPQSLATELGIDHVRMLDEAEAVAHAIPSLGPEDVVALGGGEAGENGNQLVISAGASPGVAGLYWDGTEHRPFASEAEHADFAPSSAEQRRLALHLSEQTPRVTLGLLLSSAGLALIDRFVRGAREPESAGGPPSREAIDLFLAIYASAAGNLALALRATGGVYLAGDVIPDLRAPLASDAFRSAFTGKAPMEETLRRVPLHAVINPRTGLLGAASVAARALRTQRGGGWAS